MWETVYEEGAHVRKLDVVKMSVITTMPASDLPPGTPFCLEGLHAPVGTSKATGASTLYMNGKKVVVLQAAAPGSKTGTVLCDFAETPAIMMRTLVNTSATIGAYAGETPATPAQAHQMEALQKMWGTMATKAADATALAAKALAPDASKALAAHAEHLQSLDGKDLAAFTPLFATPVYDEGRRALVVQSGVKPWCALTVDVEDDEVENGVKQKQLPIAGHLLALAEGGAAADKLPPAFASMVCTNVAFTGNADTGHGLAIECAVSHVADTAKAREDLAASKMSQPWLSGGPTCAFSMAADHYAWLFGTLDRDMFKMVAPELFTWGRWAGEAKILPVQRTAGTDAVTVQAAWPEGGELAFDMPASFANFPKVSKAWVLTQLCAQPDGDDGVRGLAHDQRGDDVLAAEQPADAADARHDGLPGAHDAKGRRLVAGGARRRHRVPHHLRGRRRQCRQAEGGGFRHGGGRGAHCQHGGDGRQADQQVAQDGVLGVRHQGVEGAEACARTRS